MPNVKESWRMFDQISSTYDKVNRILSLGMDQQWRRELFHFLPKKKNLQLLDLATGTGDQLFSLFETGAPIQAAVGIDLSAEMLQRAKEKVASKPYAGKIEWRRADAEHLPFDANTFDTATFSFGIRNVPHPLTALREIHRVLKSGGRVLILEFSMPPQPVRPFYLGYLRHILPRLGGYFSKAPFAYRYLNETIEIFPSGKAFGALMEEAGFAPIAYRRMALGAVTLYIGEKE